MAGQSHGVGRGVFQSNDKFASVGRPGVDACRNRGREHGTQAVTADLARGAIRCARSIELAGARIRIWAGIRQRLARHSHHHAPCLHSGCRVAAACISARTTTHCRTHLLGSVRGGLRPFFGPQASRLYDYSLLQNHGTISGQVASNSFLTHEGGGYWNTDGTDDVATCEANLAGADEFTISAWVMKFSAPGSLVLDVQQLPINGMEFYLLAEPFTGLQKMAERLGTHQRLLVTGRGRILRWFIGSIITAYINGVSQSLTLSGVIPAILGTAPGNFAIGYWSGSGYANNWISDVMIHSRALHPNEVRLLASRRAIAWIPRPRSQVSMAGVFEGSAMDAANTGAQT